MKNLQHLIHYLPSQKNIDCCSANAVLLSAEMILFSEGIKEYFSRLYLYYMSRFLTNRVGKSGTGIRDTLIALEAFGVPRNEVWPFIEEVVDVHPNFSVITDASYHRMNSYKRILPDQIKFYIDNEFSVIAGMHIGRLFPGIQGSIVNHRYIPINTTNNRQFKGHAVTIIGYDDNLNNGSWIIANFAGPKWGDHGIAAIPYSCSADMLEIYVITGFAGITLEKKFQ